MTPARPSGSSSSPCFWTGFFVLEGFDFGVGMLHPSRRPRRGGAADRRSTRSGPFWDGNEVWLIVASGGHLRGVPGAGTRPWFSASYLAILLLLVALIMRGVSFEFRGKVDREPWRSTVDVGRSRPAACWRRSCSAWLSANLLVGLPIDSDQEFTGTFFNLLTGVWPLDGTHPGGALPAPRFDVPGAADHGCPRGARPRSRAVVRCRELRCGRRVRLVDAHHRRRGCRGCTWSSRWRRSQLWSPW